MSATPAGSTPDRPGDDGYTGLPAWVKWSLIVVLAVVVVLAVARLLGAGNHGPGRHASAHGGASVAVHVLAR